MNEIEKTKARIAELELNQKNDEIIHNCAAAIYYLGPEPRRTTTFDDGVEGFNAIPFENIGDKGKYRQIAQLAIAHQITELRTLPGKFEELLAVGE